MRYDEREGEREREIRLSKNVGQEGIAVGDGGERVKQENILNTDLPMHRKTPTPPGVVSCP